MQYDVIVVGAGFAGMYSLYKFRGLGFSVRVLEAGSGVGGTWYWNRYPGARCDVQSMDYCFSFDEELQREWNWSEKYAPQAEILRYANHVADRYDLRRDIQFDTRVSSAHFDEENTCWRIRTEAGEAFEAAYCVFATGCLSVPKEVDIEGLESFEGEVYHTARWPEEGVDFSGMRVGVVGTGSSAIQSIPLIAKQASELTVYQRTPAFSLPAYNRELAEDEREAWKARYPEHRHRSRHSSFGVPDAPLDTGAFEVDAAERERKYQAAWERGEIVAVMQQFNDLLIDKAANATAADFVRGKIREVVHDPETAELLCPTSFPIGTKRICLDTDYYATFNQSHVKLVDLRKTPIQRITEDGVQTSEAEHPYDAIVLATGFDAMTGAVENVDLRGKGGRPLKEKWSEGPRTYLGLAVEGFPNLFMITGPGSPSVMSNMILSIEQHVEWIADCLVYLRDHRHDVIEALPDAEQSWVDHVNQVADATLFPEAASWYVGANVPGKPRIFMPYIGGMAVYREKCDEVAASGYAGFQLG